MEKYIVPILPRKGDDIPLENIVDSVNGAVLCVVRDPLLLILLLPQSLFHLLVVHLGLPATEDTLVYFRATTGVKLFIGSKVQCMF